MPKLTWDDTGKKFYETGVKKGVLYPMSTEGTYETGVAWNGLTGVTENPSGAEATNLYANDQKYGSILSAEEFGCTIEAYTYPEEFAACNGEAEMNPGVYVAQQTRKKFGFSYVTTIGNDSLGTDYGYKIHLVYGCTASPSERSHATINDSPEAETLSYEVTCDPIKVDGMKASAHIIIDSTKIGETQLEALEKKLYGDDDSGSPTLPLPSELKTLTTVSD